MTKPNENQINCVEKLTQLVECYQKNLLNLCYIYLHDYAMAEDAVQETFLKAYRAMDSFRGNSQIKTWLMKIAINTCRDMRKSAWSLHVDRHVTPEDLPSTVFQNSHPEAIDLANGIMQLPDKYKEVILLHYFEALSMTDIAPIIGITPSMVSKRIKKAREKLHNLLGKEYLYE